MGADFVPWLSPHLSYFAIYYRPAPQGMGSDTHFCPHRQTPLLLLYIRLCWRYIGRNDANYSIKIDNKRKRAVDFKKEEEVLAIEDLK
jgi:hypothetical protein